MAAMANINVILEAVSLTPKLHSIKPSPKKVKLIENAEKKMAKIEENQPQNTRRRNIAIGLASFALFAINGCRKSLAEDNGFWVIGPLPVPSVANDIANKETGTRTFVKQGLYVANIGTRGRMYRLNKCAFDLMALGDMIGSDAWNYIAKYLRIKATMMYIDFDNVISASEPNDKQPLTDLANRLFDNIESLEDAVKKKNLPLTESRYQETVILLQEVMSKWPKVLNSTFEVLSMK